LVARIGLPDILGQRGSAIEAMLVSSLFRDRMQRLFNRVAEAGAKRAAPVVADAVRAVGTDNARAILKGSPQAATALLRSQMGNALIEAMVPELGLALRVARDPVLSQVLSRTTGIDVAALANALSRDVDAAIWREIGLAEQEIRANPESTRDALLIAVLRGL
jgi:hypothetical protein